MAHEEQPQDKATGDAKALDELRTQIDRLDRQIIEVLNARAQVVVKIGARKREHALPIYAPDREAKVLRKVLDLNEGPIPPRSLEAIYRELMSASFALEQPLRVGFLGPAGSFSHVAASAHFGSSVSFAEAHEIADVFDELRRGHVDYGLVPAENSVGGGIVESLDAFVRLGREGGVGEVSVYSEALVQIRHNLLANCEPDELGDIREIHSKPEVFTQCRHWVRRHFPQATLVPAASSSAAVRHAKAQHLAGERGVAAIGSRLAADTYGVRVCFASIEDEPNNLTRFWILAAQQSAPSGDDKTTVMFRTAHTPGALVEVLGVFADAQVNLTHIEKRPSGRENWSYTFFADLVGHRETAQVARAIERAASVCEQLDVLGSYPTARRVL